MRNHNLRKNTETLRDDCDLLSNRSLKNTLSILYLCTHIWKHILVYINLFVCGLFMGQNLQPKKSSCFWQRPLTGTASTQAALVPLPLSPASCSSSHAQGWTVFTRSERTYSAAKHPWCPNLSRPDWEWSSGATAAGVLKCCQTPRRLRKESDPQPRTDPSEAQGSK